MKVNCIVCNSFICKHKVLYLTLKRVHFNKILKKEKVEEYREIKQYWAKRLLGKHYTHIQFRNGYQSDSPTILIQYLGLGINKHYEEKLCFTLRLGKIIKTENIK